LIKNNSIALKAPHLASEFHPTKNIKSFDQISYASNKKVWWLCQKGHEWQTAPGNRYRGTGCPGCSGRRLSKENNFAVKCPHLVPEWHPDKNGTLTPHDVPPRGKIKIWWVCEYGHEWKATTGNRYSGTGCPDCAEKRVSTKHNLAFKYPDLLTEWHPEKNQDLQPDQVTPGNSDKRIWWKCKKGHEWQSAIKTRITGSKCPFCIGRRASAENNFAVKFPHLLSELHPNKNNFMLTEITTGSKKLVWWQCKFGHEWQAPAYSRSRGHGCPKCNFRSSRLEVRIYCELKHIFSDALWQSKIHKREMDVFIPSHMLCIEVDGWYWHKATDRYVADKKKDELLGGEGITLVRVIDDRIETKISEYSVPYKNGEQEHGVVLRLLRFLVEKLNFPNAILEKINDYVALNKFMNEADYNHIFSCLPGPLLANSVANNELLVNEWNPKNTLSPSNYSCGSREKVLWLCDKDHEWEAVIGSRAAGRGCPFCSRKRASVENNLLIKNPKLAEEFHTMKNHPLTPDLILPTSNKKIWWLCVKGHEWRATVCNRHSGTRCPDCVGKRLSANHNLVLKYPRLVKEWHTERNFPLTPYDVTPKSSVKVWWICVKGHEWQTSIEKRTRGRGCHICTGQNHLISKYVNTN
jgi:hypothetical protein